MTDPRRYPDEPLILPLDGWLYEAHPVKGCPVCAQAETALNAAKRAGNASARFEAARTIRAHRDGHR
ncbi:hypothetical protein ABZU86_23870 [Streptomyces sp. NPDC005271]|uniref:hypothetical protein n=1 Tax=unclassified Streptomyces TaxID=2593676 RepID=UPI0033B7C097